MRAEGRPLQRVQLIRRLTLLICLFGQASMNISGLLLSTRILRALKLDLYPDFMERVGRSLALCGVVVSLVRQSFAFH